MQQGQFLGVLIDLLSLQPISRQAGGLQVHAGSSYPVV